jgi:hypothetical protein
VFPPPRGWPLGLTLGLILAIVVAAVLGTLSTLEQRRELRDERAARQALLAEYLAPLAAALEQSPSIAAVRERVTWFQRAWVSRGHPDHGLKVIDGEGQPVAFEAPEGSLVPPTNALIARVELRSAVLPGGMGVLEAWQDADDLAAEERERTGLWVLDLLLTSLCLVLAVEVSVHLLVGRPLGRLVRSLQRVEAGYSGDPDCGPGAWEIRWLAWRFHGLREELAESARRLVVAERRATTSGHADARLAKGRFAPGSEQARKEPGDRLESEITLRHIENTCRVLEALRPGDGPAIEVAEEAWQEAVVEAERLGEMELKSRLEDGALRLLEPETFTSLSRQLEALQVERRDWLRTIERDLASLLADAKVGSATIQHRVKHTAGAWRKMQERHLALEEVHDLFAFRIVVPEESDCYIALHAVHNAFDPDPFRFKDYIATPKENGYRSLHTSVRDRQGRVFEVQIRTEEMHLEAEKGPAAHWRYRADRWGRVVRLRPKGRWRRQLARLTGRA